MKLDAGAYARLLDELSAESTGKELSERLDRFLALVRQNRATALLPRVVEAFERLVAQRTGKAIVKIETEKENPHLIKGARVYADDRLVRVNLRDRLNVLYEHLTASH